jgi:alkaline phosphatase
VVWQLQDVSEQSDQYSLFLTCATELNAAYPEYLWYPEVLANVTNSAEQTAREYARHKQMSPSDDMTAYIKKLVTKRLGVQDASTEEIALLVKQPELAAYTFADIVSRRAQAGWSTHGHSGKEYPIFRLNDIY